MSLSYGIVKSVIDNQITTATATTMITIIIIKIKKLCLGEHKPFALPSILTLKVKDKGQLYPVLFHL